MYSFMIICYLLMVINFVAITVCGLMGIYDMSFFGANHAQFGLLAILLFVFTETIVMYFFIATAKSIKNILIESNSSMSEELWSRIKNIKNIIFPQTMLTITLIGAMYIFYFGYVASNVNNSNFTYSWISLPFFILCYFHHLWTLKVKNDSFKMQVGVIKDLPNNS